MFVRQWFAPACKFLDKWKSENNRGTETVCVKVNFLSEELLLCF